LTILVANKKEYPMPTYRAPDSDASRLAFMSKAVQTATLDKANGSAYLDAALLQDLTDQYTAYNAAYEATQAALGGRVSETAESNEALDKLRMYISHLWTSISNRAQRLGLSAGVLNYYGLTSGGTRPSPASQAEWLQLAEQIISGDAKAVAAGFAPVAEPSAAELQAVLTSAIAETNDVVAADRAYDVAQANLAAFRAPADALIKEVRDVVLFNTRRMDAPSQRRILRTYGAQYRYLPDEALDADDTAPDTAAE
jgi:hypothetical protein